VEFDRLFYINLELLYTYFARTLQLHPSAYLDRMLGSLFAIYMPLDILSRVWDIYAFEGDKVLLRAAVAVLLHLEPKLYAEKEEVLRCLTKEEWDLGKEDLFMKKLGSVRES
jgi:Rab-GTPase-TBC domain